MYSLKTPLLTAILSAGLIAGTAAQAEEQLLIGSTSTSSSQYGYFVAVGQIINQHVDGVRTSVVETGATVDNLRRILRNQVDMGLVTTNVGYHAYAGEGEFESRPVDNRLLWVYSQAPQNVVMREDSGVTSMAELDGARLNPGITGSATEATTIAVMENKTAPLMAAAAVLVSIISTLIFCSASWWVIEWIIPSLSAPLTSTR